MKSGGGRRSCWEELGGSVERRWEELGAVWRS